MNSSAYTFEEYIIHFARIEAILNNRSLCYSINDHSVDYLTPGHFLIGTPLFAVPERNFFDSKSFNTRWNHIKQLHKFFWKR